MDADAQLTSSLIAIVALALVLGVIVWQLGRAKRNLSTFVEMFKAQEKEGRE